MRLFAVLVVLALSSFIAAQEPKGKEDLVKTELKRLEGTWDVIELKFLTKASTGIMRLTERFQLEIAGTVFMVLRDGKEAGRVQFTIDPAQEPKTLEFIDDKKTHKFIYAVEGNQLKLATLKPESSGPIGRPVSFDPQTLADRTSMVVIVLKRAKK